MSKLEWLDTGSTWLDFVLFSIAPIVVHIAVPDALNFSLGTLAFGVVFCASIPLYRRWGNMARHRLRANGVDLYYRVRNTYETTISFEKEVCMYPCVGTRDWLFFALRCALRCSPSFCSFPSTLPIHFFLVLSYSRNFLHHRLTLIIRHNTRCN